MAGKLHELLAVEKDLKGTMSKIILETKKTFTDRKEHFDETLKEYEPLREDDDEKLEKEFKPMVTTVPEKLSYFEGHIARVLDAVLQKETANSKAKANIVIKDEDGKEVVLGENIPVTCLVQFENILDQIRIDVYNWVPTLDPNKRWEPDSTRRNVYSTETIKRLRTKKIQKPIELSPATDKFPANVQLINSDEPAGYWVQKYWSGMITSTQKSELLERLDLLISAVKRARARANEAEVTGDRIGRKIFQYLNGK